MINKKQLPIFIVIVALVIAGAAFYGGTLYAKSMGRGGQANFANLTPEQRAARMQQGGNGNFAGRLGANAMGGLASGEVVSKDDKSVTIKLRDGGSKIIFFSASTQTMKAVTGTITDVTAGEQVTVMGTANPDGTINAQTIQIRPAGSMPIGGAPAAGQPMTK